MRVLMVTPGYYPIRGGTETIVESLSIQLNKQGVSTDVLTLNMDRKWEPKHYAKQEVINGVNVIRVPAFNYFPRLWVSPQAVFNINVFPIKFQKFLKGYDVIHFHEVELSFPFFSLVINKPKILQAHELHFGRFRRYGITKAIYNHVADLYLAIGEQVKSEFIELGIPENKIKQFPNSVDPTLFYPRGGKLKDTLLYVGRIIPSKGLHVLLKALDYLKRPVHLVVIGAPQGKDSYFINVMKMVDAVNNTGKHRVTYLGNINEKDLVEWYSKASLFVFPSVFEPFGIVLLEALASGTPVVSTRSGGISDVVRDNENALLIPERNNPMDLAEAVEYLLEHDDVRIRFGLNGRSWVCRNYSLSVAANKLEKIYEELLALKKGLQ